MVAGDWAVFGVTRCSLGGKSEARVVEKPQIKVVAAYRD
jgi:hypothetical protein